MAAAPRALSEQLKEGTAAAHAAAENVHFVKDFIQGNIPLPLYKRFVADLYHVYKALEKRLEQEALAQPRDQGGIVAPIFFPWELSRTESLEADLEHWLGADWRTAPELEPSPCTLEYVQRIERTTPAGIVAHAYTRYMGDLSGGQVLLRKAQKAFGLQRGSTEGLSFYIFSNIERAKVFKDTFRLELDRLEPEPQLAQEIVAEANVAFLLNMRLFAELDVMAGVPDAELPPLAEAVDSLIAQARKEAEEAAALRAKGLAPKPCECPFANLGKYFENCDFRWLMKLHESEGEKERFEADVAREKAKRLAAAEAVETSADAEEAGATKAVEVESGQCPLRVVTGKSVCLAAIMALLAWVLLTSADLGLGVSAHE